MPSSAVRVLELKLQIDTRQFDAGIQRVLQGLSQLRQAMQGMGNISVRLSSNMNQTSNSMNRATRSTHDLGNSFVHTERKSKSFFQSTQGGFRLFGQGGKITRAIAVVRNYLLLYSFALGGVVVALNKAVQASVEYTNAMVGLGAIARATGQDINAVQNAAKDLAAKGFMNVSESAMGLKNLLATGFGLQDAMKVMKGFADSAAFNRQASFQWGEAVVRATEGIRLGLCIAEGSLIYDASTNNYKKVEDLFDECMDEDKKLITLGYDIDKNDFISVQASHITYNGVKPIYKIKTSSGKEVEATENHRFLTKDGYKLLKDLKVNDILIGMDNHSTINKKPKKEIKCKNCDIYFLPSNGREYLCLDCKTVICKQCGKNFIVKPKFLKTAHFCSKDCLANWQSENMSGFNSSVTKHGDSFTLISLVCKNCGVEYQRTKKWLKNNKSSFCSFECKKEWQKGKTARKFFTSVIRKCETCGKEVTVKNCHKDTFRFCSKNCRAVWQSEVLMNKENNPNWGGGTTEGRKVLEGRKEYRKWKNAVKKRDLLVCQNCGIEFNLHVHHIFHYKNYPDRVYDISNGITLCQSCHIQAHQVNRTFNKTEETIFSIEYVGEKRTYDLSVPETRNFVVNGLVSHNSNVADACFVYTTPILTDKGIVSIGDIVEKNLDVAVYSYDFKKKKVIKKKIINRFNNGEKEVYRITTESGKSFIATGNHRFYTLDGSKKELLEFNIGEELVLWEHQENSAPINILSGDKILSIEFEGTAITYNITVEEFHNYFVGSDNTFILSSNSGITKNLSQILVEQGKSQQDVNRISSDASVRQALLNGLMKEFTLYAGNAELALNNYSGSVSILSTSFFNFRKELGDSLIPLFSEFVKRITLVIQEWTKWYKINKDVIALKLDQYFGQEIDYLIALIKWLGQATVSLVKFIGENKNLVFVIVLLGAFFKAWMPLYKLTTLVIDFTLAIKGLVVMSKSLGFISALTVAFGPAAPIMVGLTAAVVALTAAFFLLRKEEIDTSKVELEQVAKRQRLLRIMQDHNETLTNLTRSELEYVRAKIKAGDSSTELARKEMYLTDSLRDLEAQTLDTLYAIEQLDLKQSQIKFNKIVREDIYPEGFWSGDMNEEQAKLVQLRLKLRTDVFEKIAAADRNTPSVVWENYLKTLNEDFRTLSTTGLQVYEELNDKEKESFIGMKQHYQVAIGFVAARIEKQRELTTQITEITDAQKAAIKRFDEAIRKLKQDTDELNKPRGVPREVEKAQNRIEDIMKLGKEAGKSAEELDKLKNIFNAYVMAVSTDVATKEYTQILKEMNQELSELEKRMKTAEEASKSLFAKSSERGGQAQDIMTNIRRTTGLRGAAYKALGISPEDIGGKTRVNELAAEQKIELEQIRTNRDEQLKIYQELYLKKLGFTEIYNQKVLELNEQTGAAILQTEQFYAAKQAEEKQKQVEQLTQSMQQIINAVSSQVQNVANAYWTERDEIKRARDAELNDLKLQYDQGVIQAQEYAARRNLIMRNADIEMSNVTKKAWKDVSTSVLNTVGQMLSQLVAEQAAAVAKTNMLKGLGMSLAGGLGVGLLLAAGTYAISKSFAETPTQNYQDIYPSGGTTAEERKRYGSLASAPVQFITISPSVSFENAGGGQIFIGSGSVSEFSDEVSQVIKETINSAVANNEIMLDGLSPK